MEKMKSKEIMNDICQGIFAWYPFVGNADVLFINNSDNDGIADLLSRKNMYVTTVSSNEIPSKGEFRYVIFSGVLEKEKEPEKLLQKIRHVMSTDGTLLVAFDNRLGMRYFAGERDPYTEHAYDGVEHYRRGQSEDGRCLSRSDVDDLLCGAGFELTDAKRRYYSVTPDIEFPQFIYADDYMHKEELSTRFFPLYHHPETVFLEEEHLITDFTRNGLFPAMANGVILEYSLSEDLSGINAATVCADRGHDNSGVTLIRRDGLVEKKAVFPEGKDRLKKMLDHDIDLRAHGIKVLDSEFRNGSYFTEYQHAESAVTWLKHLAETDKDGFIETMDRYRQLILMSSEHIDMPSSEEICSMLPNDLTLEEFIGNGEDTGIWLETGYLDMMPLNAFIIDDEFVFFDQEFAVNKYPANAIILRALDVVYSSKPKTDVSIDFFLDRWGILSRQEVWYRFMGKFVHDLRHMDEMDEYYKCRRRHEEQVQKNRMRLDYPADRYRYIFEDIFHGLSGKRLFLFGTGKFAQKFLAMYQEEYPVSGFLDNNVEKQGTYFHESPIIAPEKLTEMRVGSFHVMICIKNYFPIIRQLEKMGITDYSVYDASKGYPYALRPTKESQLKITGGERKSDKKKYKVGYLAGVFDLYHVGHLNMFRRAKEMCDYLIVGVVSDEAVRRSPNKKGGPFIPFEERLEIVRSCKYVDQAEEIPVDYPGTEDAWRKYHFDVQFSGSDYENDPAWLNWKKFLEERGSTIEFFPYTQCTSSTKLKGLIDRELID